MANRTNVLLTFVRGHRNYTKAWLEDAVRYGLVKYHPIKKDHVDPPITPSKVLMIYRVKPFKGNPYWDKDTLTKLGFEEHCNDPVFVKNIPEVCAELWKIKHLIKVIPVKLPEKLPDVDDQTEFRVDEMGKVRVTGKVDPARYQATMEARNSIKRMDGKDISEKLRLKWLQGNLI
ncbi:mitochondrial ribosomal protein L30 [Xylocopa sonorina]|uniref:mitochondrial ribosomal protein L30 n=1 Tax=Xylocopa sonorina TaxID=1818115 RepID=UPI00403B134A